MSSSGEVPRDQVAVDIFDESYTPNTRSSVHGDVSNDASFECSDRSAFSGDDVFSNSNYNDDVPCFSESDHCCGDNGENDSDHNLSCTWRDDWCSWPSQPAHKDPEGEWVREQRSSLLKMQEEYSESYIARRVAKLDILVGYEVEHFFANLEEQVRTKINERRSLRAIKERQERTILVDTESALQRVLGRLAELDHSRPQVVVDCEGLIVRGAINLDIVELFIRPDDMLYLIDVNMMKERAWSVTADHSGFCLREFLSSSACQKIMWDPRMDAHILQQLFGIRLSGVIDASLWAIAYRRHKNSLYDNYRVSIEAACREVLRRKVSAAELKSLEDAKEERFRLPPRPWIIRPLLPSLVDYAADVKYMGMIYDVLSRRLGRDKSLVHQIQSFTIQELDIACSPYWDALGETEATSPWNSGYLKGCAMAVKLCQEEAEQA